jgi:hypothetical protein
MKIYHKKKNKKKMKNINQTINRFKLLMEYDTSKTLDENSTLLFEAPNPFASLIKSISKSSIDDVIKSARGGLKTTAGKAISNSDDLIKALERNVVSAANIGKVRTGLIKSSNLTLANKTALIDDFVKNPNVFNKYKNMKATDISSRFKAAGYPDDVAKSIAQKIRKQAGQMTTTTSKIQTALSSAKQSVLTQGAKSWNWSSWLKWGSVIGLGAAGVYAVIQLMKEDGTLTDNPEGTPETSPEDTGGTGGGNTGGGEYQPKEDGAYTTPGDPYQYKVVNGQWYTKSWKNRGKIIKDWVSLENNPTATAELDKRHPGARVLTTPAAETPAAGTPAAGTPAAGTPAAGTPPKPDDIEQVDAENPIDLLK